MDTQDFTCPFCLELLHEPILLPCCSANYCRDCLQQMIVGGLGSCPTCRRPMPVVDANKLPVNRLVASVISKYLPEGAHRRAAEVNSDRARAPTSGTQQDHDPPQQPPPADTRAPHNREACNQMSIRELKAWLRTKGVSSAHCIEKFELVELAQSFFLSSMPPDVVTPHTEPLPHVSVEPEPEPESEPQPQPQLQPQPQSGPDQRVARRRAPLVFDALSEDEDEDVDVDEDDGKDARGEIDGGVSLHASSVTPSLPTVLAGAAAFEQEDGARPSSVATHTATSADEDAQAELPEPPVAESAAVAALVGSSASPSGLFTGDRPSSTYGFSNSAIPNSRTTSRDDVEAVVEEGNQFLVEGSVKVLKEFLRAHATAADGDWQTLVEKADLRNFALVVYERREADTMASANPQPCSAMDYGMGDDGSNGCGSCMIGLLRKLRGRGEPSEAADE
eukprot:COSAG02_NODE_1651_length_11496_cov_9.620460_10_plen_449_part_00